MTATPAPMASPTRTPSRSVERISSNDIGPSWSATRNPSPNPIRTLCTSPASPRRTTALRRAAAGPGPGVRRVLARGGALAEVEGLEGVDHDGELVEELRAQRPLDGARL